MSIDPAVIGWIAVGALSATASIPLSLRLLHPEAPQRARIMRVHYICALTVPAFGLTHALIAVVALRPFSQTGIVVASIALIALCMQLSLGNELRTQPEPRSELLKRAHLAVMVAISAMLAIHIWLD